MVDVSPPCMPPKVIRPLSKQKRSKKSKTRRQQIKARRTKQIPMAYVNRTKKPFFKITRSKKHQQEIIIEGEDLIMPTPAALPTQAVPSEIFLLLPANPLYWVGTRISGIASVYQQFRPLRYDVEYIPQVPVTCPGQVIVGTLWNNGSPSQNLQQTLMSSNGGNMGQCYTKIRSNVICDRKTLPLNYYNVHDELALNTSNPFYWMAHYSGSWQSSSTPTTNQPGWVYLRWKYAFSVGLGNRGTAVAAYTEIDPESATRSPLNIFPGWGVTLAYLKTLAVKVLRKVCIVLVNEIKAELNKIPTNGKRADKPETVSLYTGSPFTVSPEQFSRTDDKCTIKGSDGVEYQISTNERVVVYMEGDEVAQDNYTPEYNLNINEITIAGAPYTLEKMGKTDTQFQMRIYDTAATTQYGSIVLEYNSDGYFTKAAITWTIVDLTDPSFKVVINYISTDMDEQEIDFPVAYSRTLTPASGKSYAFNIEYPPNLISIYQFQNFYNGLPGSNEEPTLTWQIPEPNEIPTMNLADTMEHNRTMRILAALQRI